MLWILLTLAVVFLAYSNGANDNFKGVATLYGTGAASYRRALAWATAATLLGGLASIALAHGLMGAFSGKGLVPDELIDPAFLTSVGGAAALTIFLATLLGMPTSTTHALTGALAGAALVAAPSTLGWGVLLTDFAQPLLLSPVLAVVLTTLFYLVLHRLRRGLGVRRQTCLCIGQQSPQPVVLTGDGAALLVGARSRTVVQIGTADRCVEQYSGRLVGVTVQEGVDAVHYLSGGAVCFARAVNDTPKIAALLLAAGGTGAGGAALGSGKLLLVIGAVVIGGLMQSRAVAVTMSKRITDLHGGQGLASNLITAFLVIGASRLGMPVSTTHVSCGSIFGIGLVNRRARWRTIAHILLTWLTTLPLGLALGAAFYWVSRT